MICAYNENYLNDAMNNLGEAMDYAVNSCKISMDAFMDLFIVSGYATQFASGVPKVVCGLSGTELVCEVLAYSGLQSEFPDARIEYDYSVEYWCGWILAYYQWYTSKSFKNIQKYLRMSEIEKMYPTLHEASEDKFVDTVNAMIQREKPATHLQMLRRACGYSQKLLAQKSGVTLRSIQQYEQRAKDINKAAGVTLFALAQVLGCNVEDLLETNTSCNIIV